jgi:hypothetical protein
MRNSCSSFEKLSKSTLLAMLGQKRFVKNKIYINGWIIDDRSDDQPYSDSKNRAFFEKIKYDWEIISFDSKTRVVCVEINDPVRKKVVSVTLPKL